MEQDIQIFELDRSVEDDRPQIDFSSKANQGIDWQSLDAILRGQRLTADYNEISIKVADSNARSWGYYSVPGTLGLISAVAIERVGRSAFCLYELLPAALNDSRFYFLKPSKLLPCLDKARSEIITFRSDPNRVKEIRKHVFLTALISNPLVFSIPESQSKLYATTTVRDLIYQSGMPGFRFTLLA